MLTNLALAIGNKEEKDYTFEHKFGANPNVTSGSETVWTYGGLYPWSAWDTAGTISLASNNSADTGTLTVYGLDENWNLTNESFTLTGTTPVVSTSNWKRIYRMIYSNGSNNGAITASKDGTVVSHIEAGKSQTLVCAYTVPAGYTAYGVQWTVGCGKGGDAEFQLFTRDNYYGETFRIRGQLEIYQSTFTQTYASVFPLTQKTDIDLRTLTTTNNFKATGSFDLILRKH